MRREHWEQIRPICPLCWVDRQCQSFLGIGQVALLEGADIREGNLVCPERLCQREYPIIDGIPVVLANPASWAETQLPYVLRRSDLTPFTESILGDLAGPSSAFDRERGNNGIYAHAHWAEDRPAYLPLFQAGRALLSKRPEGLWLDVGCSTGRGTFELAKSTGQLAVGVDLNFSMLRLAESIRRTGRARYARRRVGVVFDYVDDLIPDLPVEDVSFWCVEASTIPFAAAHFDGAIAMNMLDCVPSPLALLCEVGRLIKPNAEAVFSSPFDWAIGASEISAWMGGHSQRSPHGGSSLVEFHRILSVDCSAGIDTGLTIEAEADQVKWRLQTNERSRTEYDVYVARLRRKGS